MVVIQQQDFSVATEIATLQERHDTGAVATFTGLVRNRGDQDQVTALFLEHYPGMTESTIEALIEEATARWTIQEATIIHRIGRLELGEQIVFVGVSSSHRGDAFAACEFLMDALKTRAPFWKKEITADGDGHWVEQKRSDRARTDQW
jgi:molybdopterin synthase catalytic subunit